MDPRDSHLNSQKPKRINTMLPRHSRHHASSLSDDGDDLHEESGVVHSDFSEEDLDAFPYQRLISVSHPGMHDSGLDDTYHGESAFDYMPIHPGTIEMDMPTRTPAESNSLAYDEAHKLKADDVSSVESDADDDDDGDKNGALKSVRVDCASDYSGGGMGPNSYEMREISAYNKYEFIEHNARARQNNTAIYDEYHDPEGDGDDSETAAPHQKLYGNHNNYRERSYQEVDHPVMFQSLRESTQHAQQAYHRNYDFGAMASRGVYVEKEQRPRGSRTLGHPVRIPVNQVDMELDPRARRVGPPYGFPVNEDAVRRSACDLLQGSTHRTGSLEEGHGHLSDQEASILRKKKKKRKTKDGEGGELDQNGNPRERHHSDSRADTRLDKYNRSKYPSSLEDTKRYLPTELREDGPYKQVSLRGEPLDKVMKKKKRKDKNVVTEIKADAVEGYRGEESLDSLLNFIENKKENKNKKGGDKEPVVATQNGPATKTANKKNKKNKANVLNKADSEDIAEGTAVSIGDSQEGVDSTAADNISGGGEGTAPDITAASDNSAVKLEDIERFDKDTIQHLSQVAEFQQSVFKVAAVNSNSGPVTAVKSAAVTDSHHPLVVQNEFLVNGMTAQVTDSQDISDKHLESDPPLMDTPEVYSTPPEHNDELDVISMTGEVVTSSKFSKERAGGSGLASDLDLVNMHSLENSLAHLSIPGDTFKFTDLAMTLPPKEEEFKVVSKKKHNKGQGQQDNNSVKVNMMNKKPVSGGFVHSAGFVHSNSAGFVHSNSAPTFTKPMTSRTTEHVSREARRYVPHGPHVPRSVTPPPSMTVSSCTDRQTDQRPPEQRAFSPSAFPVLGGSRERRNSTGTVTAEVSVELEAADSDLESVKSLPMSNTGSSKPAPTPTASESPLSPPPAKAPAAAVAPPTGGKSWARIAATGGNTPAVTTATATKPAAGAVPTTDAKPAAVVDSSTSSDASSALTQGQEVNVPVTSPPPPPVQQQTRDPVIGQSSEESSRKSSTSDHHDNSVQGTTNVGPSGQRPTADNININKTGVKVTEAKPPAVGCECTAQKQPPAATTLPPQKAPTRKSNPAKPKGGVVFVNSTSDNTKRGAAGLSFVFEQPHKNNSKNLALDVASARPAHSCDTSNTSPPSSSRTSAASLVFGSKSDASVAGSESGGSLNSAKSGSPRQNVFPSYMTEGHGGVEFGLDFQCGETKPEEIPPDGLPRTPGDGAEGEATISKCPKSRSSPSPCSGEKLMVDSDRLADRASPAAPSEAGSSSSARSRQNSASHGATPTPTPPMVPVQQQQVKPIQLNSMMQLPPHAMAGAPVFAAGAHMLPQMQYLPPGVQFTSLEQAMQYRAALAGAQAYNLMRPGMPPHQPPPVHLLPPLMLPPPHLPPPAMHAAMSMASMPPMSMAAPMDTTGSIPVAPAANPGTPPKNHHHAVIDYMPNNVKSPPPASVVPAPAPSKSPAPSNDSNPAPQAEEPANQSAPSEEVATPTSVEEADAHHEAGKDITEIPAPTVENEADSVTAETEVDDADIPVGVRFLPKWSREEDPNFVAGKFRKNDAVHYLKQTWDQIMDLKQKDPCSVIFYSSG